EATTPPTSGLRALRRTRRRHWSVARPGTPTGAKVPATEQGPFIRAGPVGGHRTTRRSGMSRYRMVYGDHEQVVRETFDDVDVVREDGWTVLFRGDDAILRVRDEHVQAL